MRKKVAKASAFLCALILAACGFYAGLSYKPVRADFGGDPDVTQPTTVSIYWEADGAEENYIIKGVEPEWLEELLQLPYGSTDNLRIYIPCDLNFNGSDDLPFTIGDDAFKSSKAQYAECVFTVLDFEKTSDYPDFTEADYISKLTAIGDNAFEGCAIKSADMSDMDWLTSIGGYSFYNCRQLTTVDLSGSAIKTIGERAFADCTELYLLNLEGCIDLTLGTGAFENCAKLTALDLKNSGVREIGNQAFGACTALKQIDFAGADVEVIGEKAFYGCGIEMLDLTSLPLTEIKAQAFGNCQSLKTVRMGYVQNVSADVFNLCNSLESIIFDSKETYNLYLAAGTFSAISASITYEGYSKPDGFNPWLAAGIAAVCAAALIATGFIARHTKRRNNLPALNAQSAVTSETVQTEQCEITVSVCPSLPFPPNLTRRESEIALLMLQGKKRKEIAAALFLSENTIKTHITNILDKAECKEQRSFIAKYRERE